MDSSKKNLTSKTVQNRFVSVCHSLDEDNHPVGLSVDVRYVFSDDTSRTSHSFFDYSVIPMDVAINIACEIVRGWKSETPKHQ